MSTSFAAAALPLTRPRSVPRLGSIGALIALTLVSLALIGAPLLAVGSPTSTALVRNGLLAFDSNGEIMVADPSDDYAVTQLTTTPAHETNPIWSPDGTRIAYWSRSGNTSSAGIMDAEGNVLREVTEPAGLELPEGGGPNWLPDARTIAIVGNPDFSATVLVDTDTGEARKLPTFIQLGSRSPDGSLVAWEAEGDQPPAIHVARADLSDGHVVSVAGQRTNSPVFTPDSDRIVYVEQSPDGTDGDIVSVGVDGLGRRTIVGGATNDLSPAISPDGTRVAFVRSSATSLTDCCGNRADVYVVDIAGNDQPRLVGSGVGDWGGLLWSPDGTALATFNLPSDHLVVMAVDEAVPPVEIASPVNAGVASWQAIR